MYFSSLHIVQLCQNTENNRFIINGIGSNASGGGGSNVVRGSPTARETKFWKMLKRVLCGSNAKTQ